MTERSRGIPSLRAAASEPDLRATRTAELAEALAREYDQLGRRKAEMLAHDLEGGSLTDRFWDRPTEGRRGFAILRPEPLRLLGVWIAPADETTLAALLVDLETAEGRPVTNVTDLVPGLSDAAQVHCFARAGFWHRAKVNMLRPVGSTAARAGTDPRLRPIEPRDLAPLVGVYARAYSERPGEFWTWSIPHAEEVAAEDVMGHRGEGGGWSPEFWPQLSCVAEVDGQVVGGLLTSRSASGDPYMDDLIVDPAYHRRGIGRALMERAIAEVDRGLQRPIRLSAIRFGAPYRLYRSLGFEELPFPDGRSDGAWIRGPSPY